MHHNVDLSALSLAQLRDLSRDVAEELVTREHDERIALQERLHAAVEEAGFDPADLQFRLREKSQRKTTKRAKGGSDDV